MLCESAAVLASDRSSSGESSGVPLSASEDGRRLTVLLRRRPALNCWCCGRLGFDPGSACLCCESVLSSDSSSTEFPLLSTLLPSYTFWYFHRPGFAVVVMAPAERRTAAPSRILKAFVDLVICFSVLSNFSIGR